MAAGSTIMVSLAVQCPLLIQNAVVFFDSANAVVFGSANAVVFFDLANAVVFGSANVVVFFDSANTVVLVTGVAN